MILLGKCFDIIDRINRFLLKSYNKFYSIYLTAKIDNSGGKIILGSSRLKVRIIKGNGSKLIVNGNFRISSYQGGNAPVYINLGANSVLTIDGDFDIGHGVRIVLNENSSLFFGGKLDESSSGISADTLILVYKKIRIEKGFICAWNVFISDSDWHQIIGQKHHEDIFIGEHVWIANNCSVLKGAHIGNNSIVASHSKVINGVYPDNILHGGIPAKVIKSDVNWDKNIEINY
jgi:acetyltransferase-like isoleucine patch superfamily enzyme